SDKLRAFITANERDAPKISVGKDAHVELDALPGQSFHGNVVRIAPVFDPTTRTLEAEVQLDNKDGMLRPGMYGYGSIVLEVHPNVPVVPASAIQISNDLRYVFVLHADDAKGEPKVERRKIQTGVDGGSWLEVSGGLALGDEVVTAGADGLSDGAKV